MSKPINTPPILDTFVSSLKLAEHSDLSHAEIMQESCFGLPASMRDLLIIPFSGCSYIYIHISLLPDFGVDVLPDEIVDYRVLH